MKSWVRIVGVLALLLAVGGPVVWVVTRPDEYHTPERRAAKRQMIQDIGEQVVDLDPENQLKRYEWWDDEFIQFYDGSWIAYRAQCHKVDPKVYDLFIGRASDGNWYYSTYHFCVGMLALQGHDQMDTLEDFISEYALETFDGASDQALLPTWPERAWTQQN
ncbi:hypothetical protein HAHE_06890 [Haloferula helveola]|uniref:Uncharacterized protein n=1 Tax=Haloferula helveola TaxID=490095 RepID=A0ABM7RDD6_9BACT|nr:hypothetical protein HAHE_06890 [Haloferula helveola]